MRLMLICLVLAGITTLFDSRAIASDQRPNVLFILADDLGWSDTTLYGTTKFYQTPNIERLARQGMTFTRAYSSSPLCSPTRASILTGLSPARHGITTPSCHLPQVILTPVAGLRTAPHQKAVPVTSVSRLKTDYQTLPKTLKAAGYATGHFGKWHLGHEPYSPLQHGFDVDLPHHPGPGPAGSYVAPWKFKDFDHDPDVPDQHIEDRMATEAVSWMEKHKDEPFFLNYWMFSVHAPFDAKRAFIEKHRARIDPKDPQRSPTYAAMIESMDDAVGTLLDALDRLKIADNTIVIFTSDNGGNMYNEVDGTTPTSNAPLRGAKATMFEGGIRVPCVVRWPGFVAPKTKSNALIDSCDFYPTLLDLLDLEPNEGQHFDGTSFKDSLKGISTKRKPIFTYFPHNPRVPDWLPTSVAVQDGTMKLIRLFHGGEDGAHRWMLFNLDDDIGEKKDLAASNPDKVKAYDKLIDQFLADTNAILPARNASFDPTQYRPELIGKAIPKSTRKQAKPTGTKPVAGWTPSRHSKLSLRESKLFVNSTGNDPYLSSPLPQSLPAGKYTIQLTMSSSSRGLGQLFWHEQGVQPRFFRDRSVNFEITHDGKPHSYEIAITPKQTLAGIRIDPGRAAGKIIVSSIKMLDSDKKVAYQWKFVKSPARTGK